MNETKKNPSPFVQAVLALDNHFSELVRLGAKIDAIEMKSEFDFEQAQRLMTRFAECGQSVSEEVVLMSTALSEARSQAEAAAQLVSARALQLQARKDEQQKKLEEFRMLGEKVRDLNASLSELRRPAGEVPSDEDRAKLSMRLSEFESQIRPLIDEAAQLKKDAQIAKMKILEQNADSLGQSLLAVSQKLGAFRQTHSSH